MFGGGKREGREFFTVVPFVVYHVAVVQNKQSAVRTAYAFNIICGILSDMFGGGKREGCVKAFPEAVFNESCGCKSFRVFQARL